MVQHQSTFTQVGGVLWLATFKGFTIMFDELLTKGYQEWDCISLKPSANRACQKCVRGVNGEKLFFINVYEWDLSNFGPAAISCSAESQFELKAGAYFDVSLHNAESAEATELFFKQLYTGMNCKPYDWE